MKKAVAGYLTKDLNELEKELRDLGKERRDLELKLSLGQEKKTHFRRILRKKIAVLQTVIGQKKVGL